MNTPLRISEIANRLGRSQKTLESRVKTRLGITPAALYRRLRLALARKLLQETDIRISEIAIRCGYENASAMTRAFHHEFDQTPSELRRQNL